MTLMESERKRKKTKQNNSINDENDANDETDDGQLWVIDYDNKLNADCVLQLG